MSDHTRAIEIIDERIERCQKYLERLHETLGPNIEALKSNLEWLLRDPENLNPAGRASMNWESIQRDMSECQQHARDILELKRARAVLERSCVQEKTS